MRFVLIVLVFVVGCGSAAQLRASSDSDGIRFNFDRRGEAVPVLGISVFEMDNGRRGRTVCDLDRISPASHATASMRTWLYGEVVGATYKVTECAPLDVEREYGVALYQPGHCLSFTRFRLRSDGSVVDLGPNEAGC